jgi:heme oxygenase (mycobilin-producing)
VAAEEDFQTWRNGKTGEHHGGHRSPVSTGADLLEFETGSTGSALEPV